MSVTGLANLAVKVVDLDGACRFYEEAGAEAGPMACPAYGACGRKS